MDIILLFQYPEGQATILSEEWLDTAVSIAVTYVVFILGVPALVFQTFISEPLRNIYNERLGKKWGHLFGEQIALVIVLYLLSHPCIVEFSCGKPFFGICTSFAVLGILLLILFKGYMHLMGNFKASRDIEQHLSKKIAEDAIVYFDQHKKLNSKDLEELGTLARELPAGTKKTFYLGECERFVEHLLKLPHAERDPKMVGEILEKTVCLAVTYDGVKFNAENIWKALDILNLVHSQTNSDGAPEASSSYLNTFIGKCIKDIGIIAMQKGDLRSVMRAVEKIFVIESTSRELFALGDEALRKEHWETIVTVMRKLSADVQRDLAHKKDDKRAFYFWLGLTSKVCLKEGSAGEFARRQRDTIIKETRKNKKEVLHLFKDAQAHFYNLADFDTIDALRKVQEEFQK